MSQSNKIHFSISILINLRKILLKMETIELPPAQKKFLKQYGSDILVDNAIKRNNIKQFVGQNMGLKEGSLISESSNAPEKSQLHSLSSHLMNLKASCSQVKKDIASREHSSYKFKNETSFKQQKAKVIQSTRDQLQKKIAVLNSQLEQVNIRRENVSLGVKSYEHILERMKKDDIKFQMRKNELKRQQKILEKELKEMERKYYSTKEFEQMALNGLNDANNKHYQQNVERRNQIQAISRVVLEKEDTNMRKIAREQQTFMIQEMAAGDLQDAELIRLKKFLTVQQFLRIMLKSKVQKLKQMYEPYEYAFFRIKSSTTAKDADSMKSQFFGFQENYSEKTSWVKHLEDQTLEAQAKNKDLQKKLQQAKNDQLDLLQQYGEYGTANSQNLVELSKKSFTSELLLMKIRNWAEFNVQKYGLKNMSIENNSVDEIFKALCQKIRAEHKNSQQSQRQTDNLLSRQRDIQQTQKEQQDKKTQLAEGSDNIDSKQGQQDTNNEQKCEEIHAE